VGGQLVGIRKFDVVRADGQVVTPKTETPAPGDAGVGDAAN
jgi:hypothetical protein